MKPIEIIGAGLAGLALGNALRSDGIPITLYDAGTLPRHRVCGEFICGRGSDALHALGLADTLEGASTHTSTAWYIRGRKVLERDLPEPAIGLSRYSLDRRLADAFENKGGQLKLNTRKKSVESEEALVRCHGRQAVRSDWIGLKVHCSNLQTEADLELHLGHHGYVGLSRIEDDKVNVCALFRQRRGLKAKREDWLLEYLNNCGLSQVVEKLRTSTILQDSHSGVAGVEFSRIPSTGGNSLCLGDAYSVIPPFTGNGMSIALEAAELAYPKLRDYACGLQSWTESIDRINRAQHTKFDKRLRTARWLHPWIHSGSGQLVLGALARTHLLPFSRLYSLTH